MAQQGDIHGWIYCSPSHKVLMAAPHQNIHTYVPTYLPMYIHTNRLLGILAHTRICKTNTGNDPLPVFSNHISALQLLKTAAEDRFQQRNAVGLGKEIFPCLTRHQSDISIWRQDGNTPMETNVAFHQFLLA